jgi:hypothetical protein
MKYDDNKGVATFESTGREVYCYGQFNLQNGNSLNVCYGSDGGETLDPCEAIELADDIIAKATAFKEWTLRQIGEVKP